jgi:hypothetical protein
LTVVCWFPTPLPRSEPTLSPAPLPHAGYLTLPEVFTYSGIMGTFNFLLWALVGGAWWKFLGFM